MSRPANRRRGSTLTEVMVSTGLLALVGALGISCLTQTARGSRSISTRVQLHEETRRIQVLLRRDLASLVPGRAVVEQDGDGLELRVRRTLPETGGSGPLVGNSRIRYQLEETSGGEYELHREVRELGSGAGPVSRSVLVGGLSKAAFQLLEGAQGYLVLDLVFAATLPDGSRRAVRVLLALPRG